MLTLGESLHPIVQNPVLIIPSPGLSQDFDTIQFLHFPLVPLISSPSAYKYIQGFPILRAKSKQCKVTFCALVSYPFPKLPTVPTGHSFFFTLKFPEFYTLVNFLF